MLEVAARLVRTEGVGTLTLARLAAASGVTKPIAYQHFGTREGLLCALYQRLSQHHEAAATDALANRLHGGLSAQAVADIVATAFIDCIVDNGDDYAAIVAALLASPNGAAASHALRQSAIAAYGRVLEAHLKPGGHSPVLVSDVLMGAGERLADAVRRGNVSQESAAAVLAAMLTPLLQGVAGD